MAMQITLIVVVVDFQDGHYDYHDSLQVRLIRESRKFPYSAVVSSALSFFLFTDINHDKYIDQANFNRSTLCSRGT